MSSWSSFMARVVSVASGTTLLLAGALAAPALGQSSPPAACDPATTACASPESSIVFPPMQFAGGDPTQLVFTSTCGVWGRDAIELFGQGGAGSADLVVAFSEYDPEAAQWFGTVHGSFTGTNGITTPVTGEGALIYYDFDLGQWILVASSAAQIPAAACATGSPTPS